ncbi:hypothetical protein CANCADRAFT_18258, partial [Tortispora caseinolytica NRRL Y-17796]
QDYHFEFFLDGKQITNTMTAFYALYETGLVGDTGTFWTRDHEVIFRQVPGKRESDSYNERHLQYLDTDVQDHDSHQISDRAFDNLRLLEALYSVNETLSTLMPGAFLKPVPQNLFVNAKITTKLMRQLDEPLVVASSCVPYWCILMSRRFFFILPFEARHQFMQATSFGYSRSIALWNNRDNGGSSNNRRHSTTQHNSSYGRLQRQKVRVSRNHMLQNAVKVMESYGKGPHVLEIEYFGEVGIGLGPTLEFYSLISSEFTLKKLRMWRDENPSSESRHVTAPNGLFPVPMSLKMTETESGKFLLRMFEVLGIFVARALLDSRIIDIPFNPNFFRSVVEESCSAPSMLQERQLTLDALAQIAPEHANALKRVIELAETEDEKTKQESIANLYLDFTLPGFPEYELIEGGSDIAVSVDNVDLYIKRVIEVALREGIQRQISAFCDGFSKVFPVQALESFTAEELVMICSNREIDFSMPTLLGEVKAEHGYTSESVKFRWLLETLSQMDTNEKRSFLQFMTGSPNLPIGGLSVLTPPMTVVCKEPDQGYSADDYLPSVMTCANYLKLPPYSSIEVLKKQLKKAMSDGLGPFLLS